MAPMKQALYFDFDLKGLQFLFSTFDNWGYR